MLAAHREKGGDAVRGGVAYLEAGDVARKRYANQKASEYYQKGLALLERFFSDLPRSTG